ncbi:unnamed protein product [Larinioides sclopetarius]|uniref:TATA box binding protein associated factor (TAF) histone-like fold domain-containing protein n=1 Tax=Larinioides sclopetarius TaxID=280406 RepID=A0AAV1YSQ1_9ARAC
MNGPYAMGGYEITAANEQPMMFRVCLSAVRTNQWLPPKKSHVGVFDVTCISREACKYYSISWAYSQAILRFSSQSVQSDYSDVLYYTKLLKMSEASSEDEIEVDDMQSPGSDRFLSPIEILESMDIRSFQSDFYLHSLEQCENYTHSHKRDYSSNERHNLTDTQSTESHCSSPLVYTKSHDSDCSSPEKSQLLAYTQSFKSDCSKPHKKHELTSTQSFKSSSYFPIDTQSLENDYSPDRKYQPNNAHSSKSICSYLPVDIQSLESEISCPDKKHESDGDQIPESIPSFTPIEKCSIADTYTLKFGCSSSSNGNHNLVDTHLHESAHSNLSENLYGNYTQSLQMNCSSFSNRKFNLADAQFYKIGGSSNIKRNFSGILSPEGECTSQPENLYKSHSYSPETDFSPDEALMHGSNCYSSSYRKHKLSYNGLSDNDCSLIPPVKQRLISSRSLLSNLTFSLTETISSMSSDSDLFLSLLNHGNDELSYDILLKLAGDCEKVLRQIIRTAYQFTRHSHREKLALKDLERAFKIHNVDIRSDDFEGLFNEIDRDLAEDEDISQPITCTGMWL